MSYLEIALEVVGGLRRKAPEAYAEAPTLSQQTAEEWDFQVITLANGDRWMVGRSSDNREIAWFAGSKS